jgi:hypothetical protein
MAGTELPQISMENMTQQIWKTNESIVDSFVMPKEYNYRTTNSTILER